MTGFFDTLGAIHESPLRMEKTFPKDADQGMMYSGEAASAPAFMRGLSKISDF